MSILVLVTRSLPPTMPPFHVCTLFLLSFIVLVTAADLYKVLDCRHARVLSSGHLLTRDLFLVHRSASDKDIRYAYKKLSRKYHPDKNKDPAAADRFVEVAHGEWLPRRSLKRGGLTLGTNTSV